MRIAATFLLLLFTVSAIAQITPDQKAKIDALFKSHNQNTPGAAIGVIKDGRMIYARGYGMADLEHDVPVTPDSVFYMASVSKQFVTMAILLLEEEGKLNLDDEIQKHLPDFPRYEDPLTIRHFIHHTSGVRDMLTLWALSGRDIYDRVDKDEIYEMIKRQKELNFKPGERYLYSNSCYFMLARIVKKASGMSIKDYAEQKMFGPLGMKNTHFHDDQYHIVKNRVFSYAPQKGGFRNLIMRFDLVGSGGLYSSINDLIKWDQNFYDNKLGKGGPDLINKMLTDGKLNNGSSAGYAHGIINGSYKGIKTIAHGGALAGYRTYFVQFPEEKFSVFVLGNATNFRATTKSNAIADIVLAGKLKSSPRTAGGSRAAAPKPVTLDAKSLSAFAGSYWAEVEKEAWRVFMKDGKLHVDVAGNMTVQLIPVGPAEFIGKGFPPSIRLKFYGSGTGKKMTFDQGRGIQKFSVYNPVKYGADELKEFAGNYFSEELGVFYVLKLEGGKLKMYLNNRESDTLTSIMADMLEGQNYGTFRFTRSGDKINGFRLDAGRVQNLKFEKR